jgi:hypothetical protein
MDYATLQARKLLLWSVPMLLLAIGLLIAMIAFELIPTAKDIGRDAPVVRIYPGSPALPIGVLAMIFSVLVVISKAIPAKENTFKKFTWWTTVFYVLCLPTLLLSMLLARPLQQHYFPKNGYSECDQLQGKPSLWFTDWVKNPTWCVKGKDRAWVFEQARNAAEGKAPNLETIK